MTQGAVWSAMDKHFSCPQILPEILHGANETKKSSVAKTKSADRDKSSPSGDEKDSITEKSLTLWSQSLNCDTCKMLIDAVTQPRRLKHACRLVLWRHFGNRFANCYVKLPLPPALRDYVGDLKAS